MITFIVKSISQSSAMTGFKKLSLCFSTLLFSLFRVQNSSLNKSYGSWVYLSCFASP